MKKFVLIFLGILFVLSLSAVPALGCAACYGNLQIYPEQYDQNLADSITICVVAAITTLGFCGGASIAEMRARDHRALTFSRVKSPSESEVRNALKYVFADNELQIISVNNGRVEIDSIYNGDGNFTDKESCYYDIIAKFSGALHTLLGNDNISLISLNIDARMTEGTIQKAVSLQAKRTSFDDNYKSLRHLALIDPYKAMFGKCESYYVNDILKPSFNS